MEERILGAVFLLILASLGVLAVHDETRKEGWDGITPNKKAAISSDYLTVSASTEAKQQQADSSIKP